MSSEEKKEAVKEFMVSQTKQIRRSNVSDPFFCSFLLSLFLYIKVCDLPYICIIFHFKAIEINRVNGHYS